MSDEFTIKRFLPHVGEVFHVRLDESRQLPLLLSEITRLAAEGDSRRKREPFSLVFRGPAGVQLPQQIYRVDGPGMEPFDCFLVPIGPDEHGTRFEAVYT